MRPTVDGERVNLFQMTSGVQSEYQISSFLCNFIIHELTRDASGLQDAGVEQANGEDLCDTDYADDVVFLFESVSHAQHVLDRFPRTVGRFGICFGCSWVVNYCGEIRYVKTIHILWIGSNFQRPSLSLICFPVVPDLVSCPLFVAWEVFGSISHHY